MADVALHLKEFKAYVYQGTVKNGIGKPLVFPASASFEEFRNHVANVLQVHHSKLQLIVEGPWAKGAHVAVGNEVEYQDFVSRLTLFVKNKAKSAKKPTFEVAYDVRVINCENSADVCIVSSIICDESHSSFPAKE